MLYLSLSRCCSYDNWIGKNVALGCVGDPWAWGGDLMILWCRYDMETLLCFVYGQRHLFCPSECVFLIYFTQLNCWQVKYLVLFHYPEYRESWLIFIVTSQLTQWLRCTYTFVTGSDVCANCTDCVLVLWTQVFIFWNADHHRNLWDLNSAMMFNFHVSHDAACNPWSYVGRSIGNS